ncbi:MAG: hypothetical protein ACOX0K_10680 [Oscillospiraceae bacterium]|jgi:hypothetical protein
MLTAVVVLFFLSALLVDALTLMKQMQLKREKVVYYTMMLVSFCGLITYSFFTTIPSLFGGITKVLDALFKIKG